MTGEGWFIAYFSAKDCRETFSRSGRRYPRFGKVLRCQAACQDSLDVLSLTFDLGRCFRVAIYGEGLETFGDLGFRVDLVLRRREVMSIRISLLLLVSVSLIV